MAPSVGIHPQNVRSPTLLLLRDIFTIKKDKFEDPGLVCNFFSGWKNVFQLL